MNTPFQWTKQVASHFGGTRNPMIVSWPARIKDKGGLRDQFLHIIDIVPTLYEAVGITPPTMLNGVAAEADRGHQLRVHLRRRQAPRAGARRSTSRWAATAASTTTAGWRRRLSFVPWEPNRGGFDPDKADVGALQHRRGLLPGQRPRAGRIRRSCAQLQDLWWVEAAKYNVLPLDWRGVERLNAELMGRPSLPATHDASRTIPGRSACRTRRRRRCSTSRGRSPPTSRCRTTRPRA